MKVKLPPERAVRLATGLVMFAYVTCHLISHATGVFLLDAMEAVGHDILLAPWRTPVGLVVLLASFLTHGGLGLRALFRRRHLRMPAIEAWQLGFGLAVPLLLIPHVTDARLANLLYGFDDTYFRILYFFWITDPATNLTRQFALLLVVWTHGCIGIHMWLRFRPWYRRWCIAFAAAAVGLPVLAAFGVTNAGWNTVLRAAVDPRFSAQYGPPPSGTAAAAQAAMLGPLWVELQFGYAALVAAILLGRLLRDALERRRRAVRIAYRYGRRLTVPRGFSILEASRWGRIPHASVCGGRGRCSTCRVRVVRGVEGLAAPAMIERATLDRIGAPEGIRLACQVRPQSDVTVTPLVPIGERLGGLYVNLDEGRELTVTALFVDLRESTRLAAGRLPFDAIFIVDRYIQAVTAAIQTHDGYVTSVAGDGIMSVFGLDGDAAAGARNGVAAAAAVWRSIDQVSTDLACEIGPLLRFGIGVHSGLSVVGSVGMPEHSSIQFLGDTGNVASRLEALTKDMNCSVIVSDATLVLAGLERPEWRRTNVDIRGRDGVALPVVLISRRDEIAASRADAVLQAGAPDV